MRNASLHRKTAETDVIVTLSLDEPSCKVETGNGFFDHMLELFAFHSGFGLEVKCIGDTDVDFHHSAEDIGITLGQAFTKALGDRRGIARYGSSLLPMDEALVAVAVDICGRGTFVYGLELPCERVGEFDTELVREFFTALCREFPASIHIHQIAGENTHHIIEASFKGFARAMHEATAVSGGRIMSTKGVL
ncbi:MAG TPA: imidazoleglycerol-phosphate dehydratase HisB [Bacillota bacterium]|nr:imidazoleglycerol-phosphate dehydratase HisB [Bacillota bacterium]